MLLTCLETKIGTSAATVITDIILENDAITEKEICELSAKIKAHEEEAKREEEEEEEDMRKNKYGAFTVAIVMVVYQVSHALGVATARKFEHVFS